MISLTKDSSLISFALLVCGGSDYIKNTVKLYLNSYGTEYDFAEYYIQTEDDNNEITSVIFRYNQTIYCAVGYSTDYLELSDFLNTFSDCEIISDSIILFLRDNLSDFEVYTIMSKAGELSEHTYCDGVKVYENTQKIAELVTRDLHKDKQTDFFLNTSHQLRHGQIQVYAYMVDSEPVSVAAVSLNDTDIAVIPFVYTSEHFRGNGYSKKVLTAVCSDKSREYQLLCQEHNIKFYEKCGFSQIEHCFKYRMRG